MFGVYFLDGLCNNLSQVTKLHNGVEPQGSTLIQPLSVGEGKIPMRSLSHSYLDRAGEETRLVVELSSGRSGTQIVAVVDESHEADPGLRARTTRRHAPSVRLTASVSGCGFSEIRHYRDDLCTGTTWRRVSTTRRVSSPARSRYE